MGSNIGSLLLIACAVAIAIMAIGITNPKPAQEPQPRVEEVSTHAKVEQSMDDDIRQSDSDAALEYGFCCCSADDVDANTQDLLTTLNDITAQPYFRYFKVNSEKDCPFWAVSLVCTSEADACSVGKFTEELIPRALWTKEDMSDVDIPDSHISHSTPLPPNADEWGLWGTYEDGAVYVDLVDNPEGNTGFSGPMAVKVWQAIYKENCLSSGEEKCQEVDVLRTLLSGFHMSINMHVCTNFRKDPEMTSPQRNAGIYNNPSISFYPNCEMYEKRIAPNPQFINNLYILYQFALRALSKAREQFVGDLEAYNTGEGGDETAEDAALKKSIMELFDSKLLCVKTFDETKFLESPRARELIPQMKRMMANVTHLMDCVPCEKCRIWGKLEAKGIATALKINMADQHISPNLNRSEKVALINLARQLAFSVRNVRRLAEYCPTEQKEVIEETSVHG